MKDFLLAAIAVLGLGATALAEAGPDEPVRPAAVTDDRLAPTLTALVTDLQRESGVTALLVGVWHGEVEVVAAAAGQSMTGVPATRDMHFRFGAMSISALVTILLQLDGEGVVSLDDPVSKWLPDLPEAEQVTLRMVAGSRSGYADYVTDEAFIDAFQRDVFAEWKRDRLIAIALDRGMRFPPGEGFQYSHANYILLGMALEQATGVPLEELVEARILSPLGLTQTRYSATAELADPVLHAFTTERGLFEDSTFWNPSWTSHTGFLTGDLRDLGRLTRALGSGELISRSSRQAMLAPTSVGDGGNTKARYYGLGIAVLEPWVMQFFSFGGYGGTVGYLPGRDVTLAVVTTLGETNDPGINPSTAIFERIRDALDTE